MSFVSSACLSVDIIKLRLLLLSTSKTKNAKETRNLDPILHNLATFSTITTRYDAAMHVCPDHRMQALHFTSHASSCPSILTQSVHHSTSGSDLTPAPASPSHPCLLTLSPGLALGSEHADSYWLRLHSEVHTTCAAWLISGRFYHLLIDMLCSGFWNSEINLQEKQLDCLITSPFLLSRINRTFPNVV